MKKILKNTLFVSVGLLIITVGFLFSKSHRVEAAKKHGKAFGDWIVVCNQITSNDDDKGKEIKDSTTKKETVKDQCMMTQSINLQHKDKEELTPIAIYRLGYFGDKKELRIIVTLPLGIKLIPGISIINKEESIFSAHYTYCDQVGCHVVASITEDQIDKIAATNDNSLAFMNSMGKQINMPFQAKGLKDGLKFLRK